LVGIYQVDIPPFLLTEDEKKFGLFNELLLDFFAKTNDLHVEKNEEFYKLENRKISDRAKNTYYEWWKVFENVCEKLNINEPELLDIYLEKNRINLNRVHAK